MIENHQQYQNNAIACVVDFVSGKTEVTDLYDSIRNNNALVNLLNNNSEQWNEVYPWAIRDRYVLSTQFTPLDLLLVLESRAERISGKLNIQGVLEKFLDINHVTYSPTKKYDELFKLLLDSQPRWLDVDDKYLEGLLNKAPELGKLAKKKWLREKLLLLFKYCSRPPRWIQGASWPFCENRPMVFVTQTAVKKSEFFHDDGVAYIFIDPVSHETKTVIQLY